ncbi:hypothetical protein [Streptomyces sp. NPDC059071]|uniref:hypothetical protein n=1 Tax=unclassified Streptomyces TaxID=2593676 RepID=UPI00365002F8
MEDKPTTPAELLIDLAQLHCRTVAPPLPRHPAAAGWQMQTSALAGLAARLLHALAAVAPEQAADLAAWYDGPLGEGPDPMDVTDWIVDHVARPAGADFSTWTTEARELAARAATHTPSA